MKENSWKRKIKSACKSMGIYEPAYDEVIATLAKILEKRDECDSEYRACGSDPVVPHTNKSGQVFRERNPLLRTWMDLNAQALAYWRDLGLTPAGFKRLTDKALDQGQKKTGLELALEKLGGTE